MFLNVTQNFQFPPMKKQTDIEKAIEKQSAEKTFESPQTNETHFEEVSAEKLLEDIPSSDLIAPTEKVIEASPETPGSDQENPPETPGTALQGQTLNKDGSPRKKRGRKPKGGAGENPVLETETGEDYSESLQSLVYTSLAFGVLIGGEKAVPDKAGLDELEKGLIPLAKKYPNAKLPPEAMAFITVGKYIYNQREKEPSFKEKMDENFKKLISKIKSLFGKGEK